MDISSYFFVALIVVYFVVALKYFEEAVLALPLFFPLYLFKTQFAGIPFTLVECLIYVAFFAFALRWFGSLFKKNKRSFAIAGFFKNELFLPLLLFTVAAVIGVAVTADRTLMVDGVTPFFGRKIALGILKGWIIAPILMLIMFYKVVQKQKQVLKLLNYYTSSAVFISLQAFFQVVTGGYNTPDARASGPFESANYLALYITPAILYVAIRVKESLFHVVHLEKYTLWKMPFRRGKVPLEHPENFFFIGSFLILLLALLFSKSYAAMIALLVAAVFYFGLEYLEYHNRKEIKKFPWKLAIFGLIFTASVLFTVFLIDPGKWQNVLQLQLRNSSSVRVEVYTISFNLVKDHWLTGIGLGQFPLYYQLNAVNYLGHVPFEWNMLHPHNLYVAIWLNMGLAGVISFAWILYILVKKSWPHFRTFAFHQFYETPKLRIAGFSMLLIVLVHGFLDTPFFKNDLALIFWLIAAIILLPTGEKKNN
jgi:O-antigen ligase